MANDPEREERIRLAQVQHAARRDDAKAIYQQIQAFSVDGMKAPGLAAVAGVAAALGFYSANYNSLSKDPNNLLIFNSILGWLFLSLLLTVIAPGLAYFSQLCYQVTITKEIFDYEHPFVHATPASKRRKLLGDAFRWLTVAVVVGSVLCIVRAGYLFLGLVH